MKIRRWYRPRKYVRCLWTGQTHKKPCTSPIVLRAHDLITLSNLLRGAQGQSPDQMVHMDLAASILRVLFKKDILSKH